MSLRTRINGFTAWVNLRLGPYDSLLGNVLMDLLKGNHIQQLLHSLTGKTLKKIQSMDGLTPQQKTTRIEWMVEELKKSEILPEDSVINGRMVAQKSADHLFDFLWRLVCHDIWFTWERMEFLQLNDDHLLSEVNFQWTPEPPPRKKRRRITRNTASMMSGFGASSVVQGPSPSPEPLPEGFEQFPGSDKMKQYKARMPKGGWYSYPSPDECILEMINTQLQRVSEGRKLIVYSLDDLVDSRVLCGLVNSFVPGTFTTEVMLNDRWIINLAFRTIEKMLHASNPMGSQDLSEADPKAICAYMCFFFMSSFKLKQSKAVINRLKELKLLIKESERDLVRFPQKIDTIQALKEKKALEENLDDYKREQEILSDTYDIAYITNWLEYLDEIQKDTRKTIADKMIDRFDLVPVPRNMTINELCLSIACNLQLTQGNGFYRGYEKETCTPDRRIVLRKKDTAEFMDDFTGAPGSRNIREFLGLSRHEIVVVEPSRYPDYEFYFESKSRNKILKSGSVFLYQVFPGNTTQWQRLFFKSIRDGDFVVVSKMINFFKTSHPEFINSKEANTGNTVLHTAAKFGHFEICKFLLESGCNVNSRNSSGCTPLFMAAEGLHKRCAQLLIEWGCNVKIQNFKCQVALDLMRHDEMRAYMEEVSRYWSTAVTEIVDGDVERLYQVVKDHVLKVQEMVDPAARCLHGSTLVHTAAHYGQLETLKNLIKIRVDVNCRDYQGATALHRAKDKRTIQLLLESNADINPTDEEGNTPLHVLSYGNERASECLNGVLQLIRSGVDQFFRNSRKLMPIHCAAMKGNQDVIEVFLDHSEDLFKAEIGKESKKSPPSLPFLAAIGDHIACAKWLVQKGFEFKSGECNQLFYKLIKEDMDSDNRLTTAKFLLDNGASIKLRYDKGDSIIHLATQMSGSSEVFQILLEYGADVDLPNDDNASPLFYTTKLNKFEIASILIEKGADIRRKNINGLSAFDFIHDFQEWVSCGLFTPEIIARLKAYELKHARNLIRGISKKIKTESIRQKALLNEAMQKKINKNISDEIFAHFRKQLKTGNTSRNIITMQRPRFVSHSFPSLPSTAARAHTPLPVTPAGQPAMVVKITRSLALPPLSGS